MSNETDYARGAVIDVVFDGPPGPLSGRFVEVESDGRSVRVGEWFKRDDGYWALRLSLHDAKAMSKLQAFKDYVHRRLDEAGVQFYPGGPHSAEGCRVGDRLDVVLAALPIADEAARSDVERFCKQHVRRVDGNRAAWWYDTHVGRDGMPHSVAMAAMLKRSLDYLSKRGILARKPDMAHIVGFR